MPETETWFAIEVSRAGENEWFANGTTTHDSAQAAWREVRDLRRNSIWSTQLSPRKWDLRVVRKDLVTTVEPEVKKARAPRTYRCFKCGNAGCGKPHSLCTECLHAQLNVWVKG